MFYNILSKILINNYILLIYVYNYLYNNNLINNDMNTKPIIRT